MKSVSAAIEIADRFGEVGAIDVRDEPEGEAAVAVVPERLIGHDRPQIGTADADVDDVADPLAGVPGPGSAAHAIRKVRHPVEHGMNLRHDVLAIDQDRRAARCAQRHVEHGSFLRDVDLLPAEHGVDPAAQAAVLRQADEQRHRLIADPVLRVVEIDARGLRRQSFAASRNRARTAHGDARRGCSDGVLREPSRRVGRSLVQQPSWCRWSWRMLPVDPGDRHAAARRDRARAVGRRLGAFFHMRKPPLNA